MKIRLAREGEEHRILHFYNELIEGMKDSAYPIRWTRGVYPAYEDISGAVRERSLYVAECGDDGENIIGAFIINHRQGDGYADADWIVKAPAEKTAVLHLLATAPSMQGKGIGRAMLVKAAEICRSRGDQVIRLDTLPWNIPGKRLYEGFGFRYCGDVILDYPTTGRAAFSMYEYRL